jgi:hypothetical protein
MRFDGSSAKEPLGTSRLSETAADIASEVYQGIRRRTGDVVALKKILMHQEKDGVSRSNDTMAQADRAVSHHCPARDQATEDIIA